MVASLKQGLRPEQMMRVEFDLENLGPGFRNCPSCPGEHFVFESLRIDLDQVYLRDPIRVTALQKAIQRRLRSTRITFTLLLPTYSTCLTSGLNEACGESGAP